MGDFDKVVSCFKEAGYRPRVNFFQDRLVIQKTVCILELMGVKLGYGFSLYIHGPYSPRLADDVFARKQAIQNLDSKTCLSKAESEKVATLFEESKNFDPAMLEIISTYLFLWKGLKTDYSYALANLKKLKPYYSNCQRAVGVSKANALFPPSKEEIADMLEEFKELEAATISDIVNSGLLD